MNEFMLVGLGQAGLRQRLLVAHGRPDQRSRLPAGLHGHRHPTQLHRIETKRQIQIQVASIKRRGKVTLEQRRKL